MADYLIARGCTVVGTVRRGTARGNIRHALDRIQTVDCDICDAARVGEVVERTRPRYIFHFAATTGGRTVPAHDKRLLFDTNVVGTWNLLEAVRQTGADTVVLVPGSSAEYGQASEDESPVKETNPLRPLNPYAVSKIAQGMVAYQCYLAHGVKSTRSRTFNHVGPRQSEQFVLPAFARQIAEIEHGLKPPVIEVGRLDTLRDFTDVRDIVGAYWLAVTKGTPGEVYNICSDRALSIREILERLLSLTRVDIEVKEDVGEWTGTDVHSQEGDSSKFRGATGWQPRISIEDSLKDTLEYWREAIARDDRTP